MQQRWDPTGLPVVFSSALRGRGVRRTFLMALQGVYRRLDSIYGLEARHHLSENDMLSVIPLQH